MLSSKIVGSKISNHWIGHHLEFQYGRHDETFIITILGSKCCKTLKFGTQVNFNVLILTVQ